MSKQTTRTRDQIEAEIRSLQQLLTATDYKALKHADGVISDEEYEETRQLRIDYRRQINDLEAELEAAEGQVADNE